jgi:hypothetical protein
MIIFLDGALESFAAFDSREENSEGGEDASAADREERQRVETRKRGNTLERCEPYLQEIVAAAMNTARTMPAP